MPAAPLAISSQSRKKLKTFEFHAQKSVAEEKENENSKEVSRRQNGPSQKSKDRQDHQTIGMEYPSTPKDKNRIDFADLIANPEDAFNRLITATPNDQVEWRHGPGSSATSCSQRTGQQNRKRVRSSSPTSSQQVRRSKHFAGDKDALDLESINRSLRTPKHEDPLLALWDRYADTRDREDQTPALPPLPPLSSSPNTPGSTRKGDNLRRTASCGIEWPTSVTKRRKLTHKDPHHRAKGIFAANKGVILGRESSKNSRVSMLVDSIHQSLVYKVIPEGEVLAGSSFPGRHSKPKIVHQLERPLADNNELEEAMSLSDDPEQHERSSEFGEMDFDMDDPEFLDVLNQAATQPEPSPVRNPIPSPLRKVHTHQNAVIEDVLPAPATNPKARSGTPLSVDLAQEAIQSGGFPHSALVDDVFSVDPLIPQVPSHGSFDEFDDYDETFATELAELADKIESQDVTQSVAKPIKLAHEVNQPHQLRNAASLDEFDDAFDDADDDDENDDLWKEIDHTATQPATGSRSQKCNDHRTIQRYLILDISDGQYETPQGRQRPEKVLSIKDEKSRQRYLVHLRQSWYDTRCSKGAYVHLIGNFNEYGQCFVDDKDNMVILHPDHLISATVVADSFSCTRRAILQDRIKATSSTEAPQVYGHLIHEVFGEALRQNRWDMDHLRQIVEKLVPTYVEALYEINVQLPEAVNYVMSKMPELKAWACIFVHPRLVSDAAIRDRNGAVVPMAINKLLELEEHVWSPMYGLKGNIDATVQAQMQLPTESSTRTLVVPLELKTGKRDTNEMHRAQTALYTLLLSDRYDLNVTSGILYYLETSKTFRVEGVRNEIRHMIIQRNELACYVHDKLALPPMIKREHLCKRCYAQTSCFAYHKLVEDGDGKTSGMGEVFEKAVNHLKPVQQEFFQKWDNLLTKEERDAMKFKRELWTMLSSEREAVGRCFSNVVIEPGSAAENTDTPKINRYTYSFVKHDAASGFSFLESQITAGEPIVISDEKGHFALANGFVTSVRPSRITVAVDRRLHNTRRKQSGFHPDHNQVFSAIMEAGKDGSLSASDSIENSTPTTYRIDKDEFANGMATARNNIIRIMEKDLWRARELRQLIVEQKAPTFKHSSTAYTLSGPASQQNLNIDQRHAIEKVMSAKDYALVLGMPGTGKTTTIAHIIRALVSQGKSVLLTSYTHTAVDNILLKIKNDNIPILRLGALGKIHPDVQKFADLSGMPKKTTDELEKSWTESKVVATTCLGINHAIFNHRKFDYCIVDEASQITLPVCLGPIRLAATFILVGDHYQLPPLVQNKEAQEGGLDISLFKLLSDIQPSSVVNLEHQYRMAEDIMLLSNELIYSGRLKCGTQAVASRTLQISGLEVGMEAHHHTTTTAVRAARWTQICTRSTRSNCWLEKAIAPNNRTVFLNTDTMSSSSSTDFDASELLSGSGNRITNPAEALITAQILTMLIRCGVPPRSIGVITFYRSQLALLKSMIKSVAGTNAASEVEMHTADKYQGRDKEVILLSCVRSNKSCSVGELLKDWRRVNVALTRAKSKLIIIGSARTLSGSGVEVLQGMVKIVTEKGWVQNLPANATELHAFEGSGTQTQMSQLGQHEKTNDVTTNVATKKASNTLSRTPLGATSGNVMNDKKKTEKQNGSVVKQPGKVVYGSIDVQKLLEKRPILRNVVEDLTSDNF